MSEPIRLTLVTEMIGFTSPEVKGWTGDQLVRGILAQMKIANRRGKCGPFLVLASAQWQDTFNKVYTIARIDDGHKGEAIEHPHGTTLMERVRDIINIHSTIIFLDDIEEWRIGLAEMTE